METSNDFIPDSDETDRPSCAYRVRLYEVILLYISIGVHIVDIAMDINLAIRYCVLGLYLYFSLTLIFMLIPGLINTAFSVKMYMDEEDKYRKSYWMARRKLMYVLLLFQIAPLVRYLQSLDYAKKCRKAEKDKDNAKQIKFYELMMKEDSDALLMRVTDCFLESAPQLILQIAILLTKYGETYSLVKNSLSIGSSFISLAWTMASYNRIIRFAQKTKFNISWQGTVVQFLWHISISISRILSIAIVISVYAVYTVIGILVHWICMTIWLVRSENWKFCENRFFNSLIYPIFGLVNIFTYISWSGGKTKWKYSIYYTIIGAENLAAVLIWYLTANERLMHTIYFIPLICLCVVPFFFGIMCMIVYYLYFHPTVVYSSTRTT